MKLSLIGLALLLSLALFQNCTKNKFSGDAEETQKAGGGNYDGKIFVLNDPLKPCTDGRTDLTRITYQSAKYYLDRENCVDHTPSIPLAPASVQPASSVLDPATGVERETILYKNQFLTEIAPQSPAAATFTQSLTCWNLETRNGLAEARIAESAGIYRAEVVQYDLAGNEISRFQLQVMPYTNQYGLQDYLGSNRTYSVTIKERRPGQSTAYLRTVSPAASIESNAQCR